MIKNMDNKKKLVIIIGSVITVFLIVLISFGMNNNSLNNNEPSILGDANYTCSEWTAGGWSSWIDGTPPSGLTADYPPSACSTVTSYTRIEVATSPLVCPDGTLPCYRTNTYTRTRSISSCELGEYLDGGSCKTCPIGHYCQGVDKVACAGSNYQDETGQASCKYCSGTVNDDHTSCTITPTTIDYIGVSPASADLKIGENQTLSVSAYYEGESVKIANSQVSWSSTNSSVATVSNGTITAIASGTATIIASYNGQDAYCRVTVTKDSDFIVSIPAIRSVDVGSSTTLTPTLTGAGEDDEITFTFSSSDTSVATVSNAGVVTGKKTGSATITVTATRASDNAKRTATCDLTVVSSETVDSINGESIIAIAADVGTVTGIYGAKDSNGVNVKAVWSASGAGATYAGCEDTTSCNVSFYHQGSGSSVTSTKATVTATTGGVSKTFDVTVYSYCAWDLVDSNNGPFSDSQKSSMSSTRDGMKYVKGCDAYEGWHNETDGWYYVSHYNRCCGSGTTPPVEEPVCYIKLGDGSNNTYCYGTSTECAGFTEKVEGKDSTSCDETPACYQNSNGEYVTGKFSGQSGYTYIGTSCPVTPPVESEACYIKRGDGTDNTYCFGTSSTCSGFTEKVENATSCSETPACYQKSNGEYVTGKFSGQSGYTYIGTSCPVTPPVEEPVCYVNKTTGDYKWTTTSPGEGYEIDSNIASESACVPPELPACYKDASNNYVWGLYHNDNNYTLVGDVVSEEDCHEVIDVPMTASNVRNIIYVFVGILMLFGIYVIYYSYSKRK